MSTKPFKVLVVTHTESLCSQRVLTGITDGIAEAKRLLTTTDTKISAITAAVGYTSEKYFKALFLRETGMTMSDWRRQHLSSKTDLD